MRILIMAILGLVFLTVIGVAACQFFVLGSRSSSTPTPSVQAGNVERERIGLRTIKPHWELVEWEFDEQKWRCSGRGYCKYVHKPPGGSIAWEEDYYYSGRTFIGSDGITTEFEMLTIHYSYDADRAFINVVSDNASIIALLEPLERTSSGRAGGTDDETFTTARKIMVELGIVPPNQPWNENVNIEASP